RRAVDRRDRNRDDRGREGLSDRRRGRRQQGSDFCGSARIAADSIALEGRPAEAQFRPDRGPGRGAGACGRRGDRADGRRRPERPGRYSRSDRQAQGRKRHGGGLALQSPGPVFQSKAAFNDRQPSDILDHEGEAARLRLHAESHAQGCRQESAPVRRDAPLYSGDRLRARRPDRRAQGQSPAAAARQIQVRHHPHPARRARSVDREISFQLFNPAGPRLRTARRLERRHRVRPGAASERTEIRLQSRHRQPAALAPGDSADLHRLSIRHHGAARRNARAHLPRIPGPHRLRRARSAGARRQGMKLAVIGVGYVGLVAGTCFAESGNDVVCVDIDQEKISLLNSGRVPIYEPGLEEMVRRNFADQRLIFTTDLPSAVKNSQVIFIAVGTPQGANGHADLQYVEATARGIARAMDSFKIVVTKSTVPVGTADRIKQWMAEETRQPFAVASNPEFMKEGAAVEDFMKPDRVVLGGDNEQALETLKELYDPFLRTGNPILVMDSRSAEMSKYAANAMLA